MHHGLDLIRILGDSETHVIFPQHMRTGRQEDDARLGNLRRQKRDAARLEAGHRRLLKRAPRKRRRHAKPVNFVRAPVHKGFLPLRDEHVLHLGFDQDGHVVVLPGEVECHGTEALHPAARGHHVALDLIDAKAVVHGQADVRRHLPVLRAQQHQPKVDLRQQLVQHRPPHDVLLVLLVLVLRRRVAQHVQHGRFIRAHADEVVFAKRRAADVLYMLAQLGGALDLRRELVAWWPEAKEHHLGTVVATGVADLPQEGDDHLPAGLRDGTSRHHHVPRTLLPRVIPPLTAVGERYNGHEVAGFDGEKGDSGDDEDYDEQAAEDGDG
mmetsp:Transcript_284/g.423  ORF Transcript_284/g.423 Transcript_284/m.423 type:complete len:325 (+) Transcript_284:1110-2084(+)